MCSIIDLTSNSIIPTFILPTNTSIFCYHSRHSQYNTHKPHVLHAWQKWLGVSTAFPIVYQLTPKHSLQDLSNLPFILSYGFMMLIFTVPQSLLTFDMSDRSYLLQDIITEYWAYFLINQVMKQAFSPPGSTMRNSLSSRAWNFNTIHYLHFFGK